MFRLPRADLRDDPALHGYGSFEALPCGDWYLICEFLARYLSLRFATFGFALVHLRDGSSRWCCCESCHEELLLLVYVFICWFPPVVNRLRRSDHGWISPRQMHTKTSRIGACRPSTSAEILSSSTTLSSVKIDAELARDLVVTRLLHHCSSRANMFVGASQLKLAAAAVISDRRQQAHACHRRLMPSTPCRLQEAGNSRLLVNWGLAAAFLDEPDLSSW